MNLITLSRAGDEYLENLRYYEQIKQDYLQLEFARANSCNFEMIFITTDELETEKLRNHELDETLITILQEVWQKICDSKKNRVNDIQKSFQTIDDHCTRLINPEHEDGFLIRRFKSGTKLNQVFLFLDEGSWFPLESLFMAARAWKVFEGVIPIHMSAVLIQGNLYLFGGPSGAGKSTVANLLTLEGAWLLDEDQVIIRKQKEVGYSANAWGYSLQSCNAPIRAVFQLIKDEQNCVERLSSIQAAAFLMSQAEQVVGWLLHDSLYSRLFRMTSNMAREVPAFQLRFSKEGGFWKTIQEALNARGC